MMLSNDYKDMLLALSEEGAKFLLIDAYAMASQKNQPYPPSSTRPSQGGLTSVRPFLSLRPVPVGCKRLYFLSCEIGRDTA